MTAIKTMYTLQTGDRGGKKIKDSRKMHFEVELDRREEVTLHRYSMFEKLSYKGFSEYVLHSFYLCCHLPNVYFICLGKAPW